METKNFKISTLRVVDKYKMLDSMTEERKKKAIEKYANKIAQYYVQVSYDNGVFVVVDNIDYFYVIQAKQINVINVAINVNEIDIIKQKLLFRAKKEILNPMLAAFIYSELKEIGGMSQDEISKEIKKTQGAISNKTRLIQLPTTVQIAIIKEQIKERHGRAILQLRNREDYNLQAHDIVKKIVQNNLKVDEVDDIVSTLLGKSVGKRETLKLVALDEKNQLKRKELKLVINEINREMDELQKKLTAHFPKLEFEKEEGTDRDDYVFLIKMKGINK